MAAVGVAIRVVNSNFVKLEVGGLNAESLNRSVLNVQAGDGRVIQIMGIEELGLGLAAVGTFTVPPLLTTAVNGVVGGSRHSNV